MLKTINNAHKATHAPLRPQAEPGFKAPEAEISAAVGITQFSLCGALKLEEKIFSDTDAYVADVAIRKAIANKIAQGSGVRGVRFRENTGLSELSLASSSALPLCELPQGLSLSLDFGFCAQSILCYRSSRPEALYKNRLFSGLKHENRLFFPTSFKQACEMPFGYEVELRGQGKMDQSQGLTLSEGVGVLGFAKAGAALSLGSAQSTIQEYSLSILALDGQNKVRIKLAKIDEKMAEIYCKLRLGLLSLASSTGTSEEGILKTLVKNFSKSQVESISKSYGSLLLSFGKSSSAKDSVIGCYDLDLRRPAAQKAFDGLLRLSPRLADKLALENNSGISIVSFKEHEQKIVSSTHITALGRQLWFHERAGIDCDGLVIAPDGHRAIYCEKLYKEQFNSIIYGSRKIAFEGIEVIEDNKEPIVYYKFSFEQFSKIPKQSEVDQFFLLASKLGIKSSGNLQSKLIEMRRIKKLVSDIDDTLALIEIFFTQQGIKKLQKANAKTGFLAFRNSNDFDGLADQDRSLANELLEEYDQLKNQIWTFCGYRASLQDLAFEYQQNFKRNFKNDYESFQKAKQFGSMVARFMNPRNTRNVKDFFAALGKADTFTYQEILLALVFLAGRENTLVHKLSMTGGNIALESIDEGDIKHPRDLAKNMFSRIS